MHPQRARLYREILHYAYAAAKQSRPLSDQSCLCGPSESGGLPRDDSRRFLGGDWSPPSVWKDDFHRGRFRPSPLDGLQNAIFTLPVLFPGRPQRHVYLVNPCAFLEAMQPAAVFIEAESFSLSALQWGLAAYFKHIPFGLQAAENLDRRFPSPVAAYRTWLLERARFVAARSVTAGQLAQQWGARGEVVVVPHAVPEWRVPRMPSERFTLGYAGRLVPEKGIWDLIEAFHR